MLCGPVLPGILHSALSAEDKVIFCEAFFDHTAASRGDAPTVGWKREVKKCSLDHKLLEEESQYLGPLLSSKLMAKGSLLLPIL